MKVLITGTSQGIGKAIAERFLIKGHDVIGVDRSESSISAENYTHVIADVRDIDKMPEITGVEILINSAGTQNEDDIDINLKSLIRFTEKYGLQKDIRSILNIGSASGHTGSEFPEYCASKGGVIAYTKNVALRVAQYGATCNSLDPGGVFTPLNDCVVNDPDSGKPFLHRSVHSRRRGRVHKLTVHLAGIIKDAVLSDRIFHVHMYRNYFTITYVVSGAAFPLRMPSSTLKVFP